MKPMEGLKTRHIVLGLCGIAVVVGAGLGVKQNIEAGNEAVEPFQSLIEFVASLIV